MGTVRIFGVWRFTHTARGCSACLLLPRCWLLMPIHSLVLIENFIENIVGKNCLLRELLAALNIEDELHPCPLVAQSGDHIAVLRTMSLNGVRHLLPA